MYLIGRSSALPDCRDAQVAGMERHLEANVEAFIKMEFSL